jgi:nicotinate-nucleotide adenylyltransferase
MSSSTSLTRLVPDPPATAPGVLRVGLFGGSFNPVHLGHRLVAEAACEELGLDRLVFVPAAQSPFKPGGALLPGSWRVRLLRLALTGEPRFEIDLQETLRGGVSYTIDTLRDYRQRLPTARIFYLVGGDHVALLPKWREAAELARLAEFVVVHRPGQPREELPAPFRGSHLRGIPIALSASDIRGRIRSGRPWAGLVHPAVAEAIHNYRLYL